MDALAPCRAASRSEHERQATARLLAAIDELRTSRCRVGLVGATNRRAAVDGALQRAGRLDAEVALGALGEQERLAVLRCCTQRMPLAPCVDLPAIAAQLRGYVAADVAAVASEAGLLCAAEAVQAAEAGGRLAEVGSEGFLAGLLVTAGHFQAAAARLGPSVLRGLSPEVPQVGWDDVGGLQVRAACASSAPSDAAARQCRRWLLDQRSCCPPGLGQLGCCRGRCGMQAGLRFGSQRGCSGSPC